MFHLQTFSALFKSKLQSFVSKQQQDKKQLSTLHSQDVLIDAEKSNQVKSIWNKKELQHKIIKQKKQIPMELSYYNIGKLKSRTKLNDAVINSYSYLIQKALDQNDPQENQIRILNSWVSTSLLKFSKSKKSIVRTLTKLKIKNSKQILIAILNSDSHWFFVQIHNYRIYIYDSMMKVDSYYCGLYEVRILKEILDWIFLAPHQIQVIKNYPQQTNNHDCGVMMLLGIIDVVKHSYSWSFSQQKVVSWRTKIAYELLHQEIQNF